MCVLRTLTGGDMMHLAGGSRLFGPPSRDVSSAMKFRFRPLINGEGAGNVDHPSCLPYCYS